MRTIFHVRVMLAAASAILLAGGAASLDLGALSNADVTAGLKKALDQSINLAVAQLGTTDGFLKNPRVKIDLPSKLAKAEGMMRMIGMGKGLDDLVTSMNRAAEAAVPQGKSLLKQALKNMTLEDARRILVGADDAATQYFKAATYAPLQAQFSPIISRATAKLKLTDTYDAIAQRAVALGVLKPEDATLQSYVTEKTLDGLFLMMAEEERAIRKDPLGQASSLLKKVFGAAR